MYVPLDVNFPDDDRIVDIGLAAAGLYAQALCIAKRLQRDGLVPQRALTRLLDDPYETGPLDVLESVGLIEKVQVDAGDAGPHAGRITYRICGWSKHNASDADRSGRGRQLAHQRHHVLTGNPNPSCDLCFPKKAQVDAEICEPHATCDAGRMETVMPEVEVEVEVGVENIRASADTQALVLVADASPPSTTVSKEDYPPDFEAFWSLYPRKSGKQAALKAWKNACKRRSREHIMAALEAHLVPWATFDEQFIKHASGWLNEGRYDDPPPPPRATSKPNRVDENMAKIQRSLQRMGAL